MKYPKRGSYKEAKYIQNKKKIKSQIEIILTEIRTLSKLIDHKTEGGEKL